MKYGTLQDWGVPVRAAMGSGPYAGRDARGQPCLYAVMGQESARDDLFVLLINIRNGACQRFSSPPGVSGGRPCLWSERWQRLFIGASGLEHGDRPDGGWLLWLDPKTGRIETPGVLRAGTTLHPASIAEAADGTIYLGCHGDCSLFAFNPATGEMRDCGSLDSTDQYLYVSGGADGTVAGLVTVSHPHVVVFDPRTGAHQTVGPFADTQSGIGHVALFTGADGLLYVDSHEGLFQLRGMDAIPVAERPAPQPPPALPDGTRFRFLDGHAEKAHAWRTIELRRPDGRQQILRLDYEAAGAGIYLVRGGPDGRVYGSSMLPLQFFEADPGTGRLINHGACSTASGQAYAMDWLGDKLYLSVYTHGFLCAYDPQRPYSFSALRERGGETVLVEGESDPNIPGRFRFGPEDNPRQLGRMDNVACRPRDMVAGPAGKVWVTSIPDYGMWGGTLSWYDPRTDRFGGAHRHILPDCSPIAITHLKDPDQLLVGFCIYGGSGTAPRATRAGFALWDPREDLALWTGDLGVHIIGVMDLEDAGNGLAYAIVHPAPESVLRAELMLIDFRQKRIVESAPLADVAGWPLEVSLQRDDRYLYGATRESIYRVPVGTTRIEILWRTDAGDGPTAGGALIDGRYFFGSMAKLRSVCVARGFHAAEAM